MSTGGQDVFVTCKSCGSEVSPYITECPYCGNRLRKRAPKLDRGGRPTGRDPRRGRRGRGTRPTTPAPLLSRLRRDEIPGIRGDRRPYATLALLAAGLAGCVVWRTGVGGEASNLIVAGKPGDQWWRLLTAAFAYDNTGYAFVALGAIGLFGWLLERRHGPLMPLALFLVGGIGGLAATAAAYRFPVVIGADGAALAMITAWAIPDLLELRRGGEPDGDLYGAAAIFLAAALMPLAAPHASWVADLVGVAAGLLIGVPLARAELS